ncbi:MAG: type III pantothenate kinase [Planctomycetes bacterium]|nr:type III pantothenate kinase [Planctomycetota bacterium]
MTLHSQPASLLAVDVGNSRIKFGLFHPSQDGGNVPAWPECAEFMAVPVEDPLPRGELLRWIAVGISGVVISGSNPPVVQRLLENWDLGPFQPIAVRTCAAIPVVANVDFPEKVGLDRLLNAVAVNAIRPLSRAAIVIDSGTATTVDYVSAEGEFCGGAILPGMELSAKALHQYTALLPLLPVQELARTAPIAPGRNTRDAIRNGLFWGQVGAIRELIRQVCLQRGQSVPDFEASTDNPETPWLVLTGGGGPVLAPQFPTARRMASLGMHGLVLTAWKTCRLSMDET